MIFTNKTYDYLKFVAQLGLPSVATFYFAIAAIWGLPHAEQVVGSITAADAFLGAILGISSQAYVPPAVTKSPDGDFIWDTTNPEHNALRVDFHVDPKDLVAKDQVVLNVKKINPDGKPVGV